MLLTGREDLGSGPKAFAYEPRNFQLRKGVFSRANWLWTLTTADATPTAMVWDTENEVILANAVYGFEGFVVADYVAANTAAAYRVQGAIRKGANNAATALVGTPLVTSYEDTAGMDLGVTADTTNGRLILTATGVASTSIVWRAELYVYRLTATGG
jgi:hypothetical protein